MFSPPSNPERSPTQSYSPINVPDSPLSSQQGQLTGVPRKVRDSAADLFNAIQEWNKLHIDGMNIIHAIKDKKLDQIEKGIRPAPTALQEDCDKLEDICNQVNSVVSKMKYILKNFEAIKQLEDMKKNIRPIFITWPAAKYVNTARSTFEAYEIEALLKTEVKENIAHVESKENLMLYCALWAYQPYVDSDIDLDIRGMLVETGHRWASQGP